MIPLPKPRGFWDYAIFALVMTGLLLFVFWIGASDGVRWADAMLAFAAAVLFVLAIIVVRRGEKANWIKQPRWYVQMLGVLGTFGLVFGAVYADAYLLHGRAITSSRLRHDVVLAVVLTAVTLWSLRRRSLVRSDSL
jgi:drug/metabolite transporter (DMT)-like permease